MHGQQKIIKKRTATVSRRRIRQQLASHEKRSQTREWQSESTANKIFQALLKMAGGPGRGSRGAVGLGAISSG